MLSALATNTKVHSASVEVFPGSPESRTNLKLSMRKTEVKTQITNFKIQKLQRTSVTHHLAKALCKVPSQKDSCMFTDAELWKRSNLPTYACRLMTLLSPIWIHVNMSNV